MKPYRAAAIQLCSTPSVGECLEQCEMFIEEAASKGVQLIVLPENFSFFGDDRRKCLEAKDIFQKTKVFLCTMAQRHRVALIGGGCVEPADDTRVYNTAIVVDSEGKEAVFYRKIHLFDVVLSDREYRESKYTVPGNEPVIYSSSTLGKIGLSICYDLRFPGLYQWLSHNGATVFCVPAAFTATTGEAHWKALLRARAIENTCYVIAAAQVGTHFDGRQTYGHSMIIDPWGTIIAEADCDLGVQGGPGVIIGDIDPERIRSVRKKIPSLEHRVL